MERTYQTLITLPTIIERFEYCKLNGLVCGETFGSYRRLNQLFYQGREWKEFKEYIHRRDGFCDLGVPGCQVAGALYVHHLNPLLPEDIVNHSSKCLDENNAITVSFVMHQAITYGLNYPGLYLPPTVRKPNDTIPWR